MEYKGPYFVRVYGRTLVKKIRYGFAGVQDHHLYPRNFETKDICACDSRVSTSTMNVLARGAQEIATSYHVFSPYLSALPRVGRPVGNQGGFR